MATAAWPLSAVLHRDGSVWSGSGHAGVCTHGCRNVAGTCTLVMPHSIPYPLSWGGSSFLSTSWDQNYGHLQAGKERPGQSQTTVPIPELLRWLNSSFSFAASGFPGCGNSGVANMVHPATARMETRGPIQAGAACQQDETWGSDAAASHSPGATRMPMAPTQGLLLPPAALTHEVQQLFPWDHAAVGR